jgi:hypothetical protein
MVLTIKEHADSTTRTYKNFHLGQYGKNQSNTNIFRIGPIPVSPITARSESARRFDNRKEKSRCQNRPLDYRAVDILGQFNNMT